MLSGVVDWVVFGDCLVSGDCVMFRDYLVLWSRSGISRISADNTYLYQIILFHMIAFRLSVPFSVNEYVEFHELCAEKCSLFGLY